MVNNKTLFARYALIALLFRLLAIEFELPRSNFKNILELVLPLIGIFLIFLVVRKNQIVSSIGKWIWIVNEISLILSLYMLDKPILEEVKSFTMLLLTLTIIFEVIALYYILNLNKVQIECPECKELIKKEAKKCKHCGSILTLNSSN